MRAVIILVVMVTFQIALADTDHREHGVHVHGMASLNLVAAENRLVIELDSPAMNVLGFEHEPRSDKDKEQLQNVVGILKTPLQWLKINKDASCNLKETLLESALLEGHHEHESEHHEHESEHHEHESKHHEHESKHHEHESKHHEHESKHHEHESKHHEHESEHEQTHADFVLGITYHCDKIALLETIDLSELFKRFKGMKEIEVQWIKGAKQSSVKLNQKNTRIRFPRFND